MGNFNKLPYDIKLDILSRLPAESVLESKCVSKSWRDVVQFPFFSELHLNHLVDSGKSSCIFRCRKHKDEFYYLSEFYYGEYDENCHETPFNRITRINISTPFKDYYLVGSCNGLVCFDAWHKSDQAGRYYYGPAFICNPITGEYIMLPTFEGMNSRTGFGYISSTNEYKVVRMYKSADSYVGIVKVYTLGSGKGWRNAGTLNIDMDLVGSGAGAFANGAIYWLDFSGTIILAFDLADEKVSQLPPPDRCCRLEVLGDFPSVTCVRSANCSEIWLLKRDKDNNDFYWSKKFSFGFGSHIIPPFEITKSGRLLSLCFGDGKIYSYNPKASFAKVDVSFGKYFSRVILHKNTFISLKVLGEKDTKTMESGERASSSEVMQSSA